MPEGCIHCPVLLGTVLSTTVQVPWFLFLSRTVRVTGLSWTVLNWGSFGECAEYPMPIVGIITGKSTTSVCSTSPKSLLLTSPTLPTGEEGEANGVKTDNVSPCPLQRAGSCGSLDTTTVPGRTLSDLGRLSWKTTLGTSGGRSGSASLYRLAAPGSEGGVLPNKGKKCRGGFMENGNCVAMDEPFGSPRSSATEPPPDCHLDSPGLPSTLVGCWVSQFS